MAGIYLCYNTDMDTEYLKLEIYIPETHFEELQKALIKADAGHIGNYDCCLSVSRVTGMWRPLPGTSPYIGKQGEISREPELKVEVTIPVSKFEETIKAVKEIHPYEEPLINAIPLYGTSFSV